MGGDISRLRREINYTNNEITKDTLSKNKMIDDIRRHADLNDSKNPKPDIPPSEIAQKSNPSSVVDSYGIPIIRGVDIGLNPSGFNTDVNKDNLKNYSADTKYIPDPTNKYLATDQYYYQQGQLYQQATNNDDDVKLTINQYIGSPGDTGHTITTGLSPNRQTLNSLLTDKNTENTALGQTNLTGVEFSFAQVQQQNSTMENQIEQNLTTHATLNEKALFQKKEIDSYKYTNYYLFIAFYVLLAILGVVLFTLNFSLSFYVKIAILCVFAIYPFVVGLLYQLLVILWNFLGAIALGNVYNKRNDVTGQSGKNEVQP
jgi:hypothetical protein